MAVLPTQGIIALHIGHGLTDQPQRLGRGHRWRRQRLAVEQAVQQVEDVSLGRTPASSAMVTALSTACSS
jgi:hypothetical protein